ncbi:transcriptional regulator, XRE family [Ammonifex degensii KC4]|uniref:Transcriptional regulator, XRE family n=1 Tax=Ammonifex degensii (strain DSM 10501 / KC4) TaxID=429009 RepID=C9R834_AMMDK|nr:helix-turn-helix transcriptional regulator [Ammonifex degensii]ACX52463.1 transcriptional regulator, XRE family [Ammonifex degensii KC4]
MNWKELKAKLMENPEFVKEYEALGPEYRLLAELVRRRLEKGLTQEELARRIGTRQSAIARLESGRTSPTLRMLKKVADALDADLEVRLRPRHG